MKTDLLFRFLVDLVKDSYARHLYQQKYQAACLHVVLLAVYVCLCHVFHLQL